MLALLIVNAAALCAAVFLIIAIQTQRLACVINISNGNLAIYRKVSTIKKLP
jgi:hypothetical protein